MLKFVLFDNWGFEVVNGFTRELQTAVKDASNPLITVDRPWEFGNITLYGSVVKVPGRPFQLWYSVIEPRWHINLAYAESEDGIHWVKPELDVFTYEGHKTNLVYTNNAHGAAVLYDDADPRPDWKYKLVCGADPDRSVYAYHSEDGIHWLPACSEAIIGNHPDCPMAFLRRPDGTYAAHHRVPGGGRRIGRSESSDFIHWQPWRIVLEPGPGDPPQFQMYGMGSTMYGNYEIGTLWDYYTDLTDVSRGKMCGFQETEFTYSRNGTAWHRPTPRQPFIPHGQPGDWESGNLQAASAPVFLDDEIRYYYAASNVRHTRRWELIEGSYGIGMASIKPDRFIALTAGPAPAEAYTRTFQLQAPEIRINADVSADGVIQMELQDSDCRPIPGFEMAQCLPISGDSLGHLVIWQGNPDPTAIVGQPIRWRMRATRAKIYSVWMPNGEAEVRYDRFQSAF
jgi:hypothetical protein